MYPHRRRNWLRGLLLFMGITLLVMVAGLAVNAHFSPAQKPQALPPAELPTPPWDMTAPPSPSPAIMSEPTPTPVPALTGPVRIVQGSELVNGVYVGFPHSTVGAVSAADELATVVVSTLDPDWAAAVMRLVADPSYAGGLSSRAGEGVRSAVSQRRTSRIWSFVPGNARCHSRQGRSSIGVAPVTGSRSRGARASA